MTEPTSSDWLGLSGRVCVVTGGGGGIGRAVADGLARAGARVAAIDLDERGLAVTQTELLNISSDAIVKRCDTSSVDSITAASETIEKALGPCGVLVNTAAVLRPGGLESLLPLLNRYTVIFTTLDDQDRGVPFVNKIAGRLAE